MSSFITRMAYRSFIMAMTAALLGAFVFAATSGPMPTASAHALDGSMNEAVQLDGPAVVRIVSVVEAILTCQQCGQDSSGNPTDIVSPQSGSLSFESSGSGAFISSDGYVLTADHVVDHSVDNPEDVNFVEQQASQDIAQQLNNGDTPDTILQFLQNHPNQVAIQFSVPFQKVFLSTDYTGALTSTGEVMTYNVSNVVAHSPVAKQDTAIIKVDLSGTSDVPFLNVAAPNSINVGDSVTAIAYPADADLALNSADFTALIDPSQSDANTINSLLGPSVNTGQVTKKDVRSDGTDVFEASSISSQGSSGGPIINTQGQIIGFVDAGPSTDRLTFLIPSEVIATYAKQAGVSTPTPGNFMTLWSKSLQEYNAASDCHWHNASRDLQKLHTQYPHFGGVQQYLAKADQQAKSETCASSSSGAGGAIALVGCALFVVILIGAIIGLVVFLRRRNRARVMTPVMAGGAPYMPTSQMGSQQPYMPTGQQSYPQQYGAPMQTGPAPMQSGPQGYGSTFNSAPSAPAQPQPYQTPYSSPVQDQRPFTPAAPTPAPMAPQQPTPQPYQTPYPSSAPQTPQPPMTPQQPYQQAPYSAPGQPQQPQQPQYPTQQPAQPQQPPFASPYATTQMGQGQTTPPATPNAPTAPVARQCLNGHYISDPQATYCPVCGAAIRQA